MRIPQGFIRLIEGIGANRALAGAAATRQVLAFLAWAADRVRGAPGGTTGHRNPEAAPRSDREGDDVTADHLGSLIASSLALPK